MDNNLNDRQEYEEALWADMTDDSAERKEHAKKYRKTGKSCIVPRSVHDI